ncbi:hypothetical protein GCM10007874_36500 [Labrys miyagiensis]|uniref:Uncharacterized protein n=1 Tax=Labrys miyagiensis TaxID=346912 RepID=A0ABQ6CLI8_9HYPH|nr:hypothetical protein [Labrys miyagiensis]GLS20633.1 hypothetical protein GCM10007874_36500 [Labrys miyagiensis]
MGREALVPCRWNGRCAEVKALLESRELILRGGLKGRFAIAEMSEIGAEGEELHFRVGEDSLALALGADLATSWAKKLATPPPSLAQKLGIGKEARVLVIGEATEPTLIEALADARATDAKAAQLSLAIVTSATELATAVTFHEALPAGAPIWIVHGKGPHAAFGEAPVRRVMREAGYRDNKVSAVSQTLSATRYARPKG